jgi:hypothetical protein
MNRNERTPRTLAETSFATGYREAVMQHGTRADRAIIIVACVCLAAWALLALLGVTL